MEPKPDEWTLEYDNDTGPEDGGFWEWWTISRGDKSYRADSKEEANWLLSALNDLPELNEALHDAMSRTDRLRNDIRAMRVRSKYTGGDFPIIPTKIAAFLKELDEYLSPLNDLPEQSINDGLDREEELRKSLRAIKSLAGEGWAKRGWDLMNEIAEIAGKALGDEDA